jgi:flagellar basal-body rod modification protein FlgD
MGGASLTEAAAKPGGAMGKDEFLQLLVAQLKNQDPLNPMNAEDFAAQLAQFSSVEQLIQINDTLAAQEEMNAAMMEVMNASSALGIIGKDVLAAGERIQITGDGTETVTVGVGGEGGEGVLTILDDKGNEVGRRELGHLGPGRQDITLGDAASGLEPGTYSYKVEVTDQAGEPVEVQTLAEVHIDGVRYGPGGPVLISGDLEIPLSDVVEVIARDPEQS